MRCDSRPSTWWTFAASTPRVNRAEMKFRLRFAGELPGRLPMGYTDWKYSLAARYGKSVVEVLDHDSFYCLVNREIEVGQVILQTISHQFPVHSDES